MNPDDVLSMIVKPGIRRFPVAAGPLLLAACLSPSPHATIQTRPATAQMTPTAAAAPEAAAAVTATERKGDALPPPELEAEPPGEDSVYFALGSAELGEMEVQRLKRVAGELNRDRTKKATLIGFTDHLGSREYSVALATKRIKVITDKLVAFGAKAKQLQRFIRGYDTRSARRCSSEACRQALRRVDIKLVAAGS